MLSLAMPLAPRRKGDGRPDEYPLAPAQTAPGRAYPLSDIPEPDKNRRCFCWGSTRYRGRTPPFLAAGAGHTETVAAPSPGRAFPPRHKRIIAGAARHSCREAAYPAPLRQSSAHRQKRRKKYRRDRNRPRESEYKPDDREGPSHARHNIPDKPAADRYRDGRAYR